MGQPNDNTAITGPTPPCGETPKRRVRLDQPSHIKPRRRPRVRLSAATIGETSVATTVAVAPLARNEITRAAEIPPGTVFLTTDQAARYLGLSPKTLNNWRTKGVVPFYRFGRAIRYSRQDLDEYAELCRRLSTSDIRA